MAVWLTSDWHFCHDRGFIYEPRGFKTVEEANETILQNHNALVKPDDEVFVLGDLMLNDNERGLDYISRMNGHLHIIRGNHDTTSRLIFYKQLPNVVSLNAADFLRYKSYNFYLSHFPCLTGNLEKESLKQTTIGLFGHTHQKEKFYQGIPYMFHVGVDSNDNKPVLIDDIIQLCEAEVVKCKSQL